MKYISMVAIVVFALFTTTRTATTATGGTNFGVAPPNFSLKGLPGETITANFRIENPLDTTSLYMIQPLGAIPKPNNTTLFIPLSSLQADHIARNLAIETTKVTIPAKSNKTVSFSIKVPETAKGTQYAGISVIRSADSGTTDTKRAEEYERKVGLGMQPGITMRIQLAISGTVSYTCSVANIKVTRASANQPPTIVVTLRNSGNGELRINPILTLVDSAEKANIRLRTTSEIAITPGGVADAIFTSADRDIPAGTYKGIISISNPEYKLPPIAVSVTVR